MNGYVISGSVVAGFVYIGLCIQIWTGRNKQSFATWGLWALIDGITAASVIVQQGNYLLPLFFSIGSIATATSIILKTKNAGWSWFETMISILVVACLLVWYTSGPKMATIAGTTAVLIAGLPQTVEAWKKPWDSSFLVYSGFLVANILSTIGGKDWSIEERFYPGCCAILCLIVVAIISRKFWISPPVVTEEK